MEPFAEEEAGEDRDGSDRAMAPTSRCAGRLPNWRPG